MRSSWGTASLESAKSRADHAHSGTPLGPKANAPAGIEWRDWSEAGLCPRVGCDEWKCGTHSSQGLVGLGSSLVPRESRPWVEANGDIVRLEERPDRTRRGSRFVHIASMDATNQGACLVPAHDLGPPHHRDATHLEAGTRVMNHERGPRIAPHVPHFVTRRAGRQKDRPPVRCEPHRYRVDRTYLWVERGKHANEAQLE